MAEPTHPSMHPLATEHLPPFVTMPGETDILFDVSVVILIVILVLFGIFYFKLIVWPHQIAHRENRARAGIVGVLGLILSSRTTTCSGSQV
ncbi:hypothetical protein [Mesorhizobium sp. CN2-181]|uniref:hypothetical protein n=1 Tax=Mesorhizobium yinganensis TaxID=3157707 RepID=UPI0032B7E4F6